MEQRTKVFYGEVGYDGLVFVTAAQVDHIARLGSSPVRADDMVGTCHSLAGAGFPRASRRRRVRAGAREGCIYWVIPLSWGFARQPMNAAAPPYVSTGGGAAHGVTLNPNLIL